MPETERVFPRWMDYRRICTKEVKSRFHGYVQCLCQLGGEAFPKGLSRIRALSCHSLDASQRSQFKKLRMLFLRNMENQDADSLLILRNMRKHFKELSDA